MLPDLPEAPRAVLERVVAALRPLPDLVALALGGSFARGTAHTDSDLDVGLYYREARPFDVSAVREVAAALDPRPERTVTDFYVWGPWVDGGAWLVVDGQRVDFLYRNLDQIERTMASAARGEHEWHAGQQPPHGFHSYVLLGELAIARPLHDPHGELARCREGVAAYPEALRERVIADFLQATRFSLLLARKWARRGDVYATAGCLARASGTLVQVVYAWNRQWFLNDKGALDVIDAGWEVPEGFASELCAILAHPGATAEELAAAVARMEALAEAVTALG